MKSFRFAVPVEGQKIFNEKFLNRIFFGIIAGQRQKESQSLLEGLEVSFKTM